MVVVFVASLLAMVAGIMTGKYLYWYGECVILRNGGVKRSYHGDTYYSYPDEPDKLWPRGEAIRRAKVMEQLLDFKLAGFADKVVERAAEAMHPDVKEERVPLHSLEGVRLGAVRNRATGQKGSR